MSLKLGNINISDVKLGNSQVNSVYLGTQKIWSKYTPFATPILDLDFQNNFIDKSPSALTMVQGQGLPTFGLSGRKSGEYCANFNGSQSIKTTTNLPINSDKVCVKFFIKTSQTSLGCLFELSQNLNANNAFACFINDLIVNRLEVVDNNISQINIGHSVSNINTSNWIHVIVSIDRTLGNVQNIIYINGVVSYVQNSANANLNGNWVNNILHIGQRAGNSLGYIGSLMKYQAFRAVPTDAQAMEIYQNDL